LAPPPASPTSPSPLQAPRPPPRPAGKDTDEGPDDENSQEVADDEVQICVPLLLVLSSIP
uniref:Uncharacterized protein n=1 Tax=Aegilops tauschii subsp. strangulata TaxID=200361 RepID=A0A453AHX3_AEGTS